MYRTTCHGLVGFALVLSLFSLTPHASAKPQQEAQTLLSAVPADVFLCVAGRHNPEREFLTDYMTDVTDALSESGIITDLMELAVSQLSEDQQENVDRLKTRFAELIGDIDWCGMGQVETAFAERMGPPKTIGSGMMMMPDMVFLARGSSDGAEKNFQALAALLRTAAEEINTAAKKEILAVTPSTLHDARIVSLRAAGQHGKKIPVSITIAVQDDVIAIGMGDELLEESLALLAGRSTNKSINATPRFKKAFANLPQAEDEQTFFDAQALLKPLNGLAQFILTQVENDAKSSDDVKNAYKNEEANAIAGEANKAYGEKDYQEALDLIRKAYEIDPTDSRLLYNLACFSALVGENEKALDWLDKAVDAGFHAPGKIQSDDDLDSLRNTTQYKAILAKAKKLVTQNPDASAKVQRIRRLVDRAMGIPGMFDYVATVSYTEGHSVHSEEIIALVPGASQNPFYPVFGKRPPVQDFDRFIPKEATSFSVSGGIDLLALYKFLEDSVRDFGPEGATALAKWEGIQEEKNFNVRKDLLSWVQGDSVTVTIPQPMGVATVFMLRVNDTETANAKLNAALASIASGMQDLAKHNPMLGAFAPQVSPATDGRLPGFQNVMIAMNPLVCGAADGHLIIGTSADAVATCLETARGDHPGIRKNETFMAEGLIPKGDFRSVSFVDERNFGKNLATGVGMMALTGGMAVASIPDPEVKQLATKLLGILGKLSPVLAKLDFYKSSATAVTFNGKQWHSHGVTNYVDPGSRPAKAQQANATE